MHRQENTAPLRVTFALFGICSLGSLAPAGQDLKAPGQDLKAPGQDLEAACQDEAGPAVQRGAVSTTKAEDSARSAERLLSLADGSILRIRARLSDVGWEVRRKGRWELLSTSPVLRQRTVKAALQEGEGLIAGLKRGDHDRRAAYARWLAQQGLYPEAMIEMDKVLRVEPGHPGVLRAIRSQYIGLELPDGVRGDLFRAGVANSSEVERETVRSGLQSYVRALVQVGAVGSAAKREVAAQRLADVSGNVNLQSVVQSAMGSRNFQYRSFASLIARRAFPGEFLRALASLSIMDGSKAVRMSSAQALGDAGTAAVLGPAITALSSENSVVRTHAVESMAHIAHPAAVQPLINHLAALKRKGSGAPSGTRANFYLGSQIAIVSDYDVEIAQGASIADPIVSIQNSGIIFDVRAQAQITQNMEIRTTIGVLNKVVGQSPGRGTAADWEQWWSQHGSEWQSRDLATDK